MFIANTRNFRGKAYITYLQTSQPPGPGDEMPCFSETESKRASKIVTYRKHQDWVQIYSLLTLVSNHPASRDARLLPSF